MSRTALRCLVLAAAVAAQAADAFAGPRRVEPLGPVHRGTEFVALEDTQLLEAYLPKGARVTVVDLRFDHGRPSVVSVALPDGYVVQGVSFARLSKAFQVAKG